MAKVTAFFVLMFGLPRLRKAKTAKTFYQPSTKYEGYSDSAGKQESLLNTRFRDKSTKGYDNVENSVLTLSNLISLVFKA